MCNLTDAFKGQWDVDGTVVESFIGIEEAINNLPDPVEIDKLEVVISDDNQDENIVEQLKTVYNG